MAKPSIPNEQSRRWRAWSRALGWSWAAVRRVRARGRSSSIAIATSDGITLDATYETASSFVLYERDAAGLRYAGLLGCGFSQPSDGVASTLRREALRGTDLVFVLDAAGERVADLGRRGPRLVRSPSARPIAELLRELSQG